MQYSSPKEYLKDLKIQRSYLSKFYYYKASEWLQPKIKQCLDCLDKEILDYENMLAEYSLKKSLEKNGAQISIYEILGE